MDKIFSQKFGFKKLVLYLSNLFFNSLIVLISCYRRSHYTKLSTVQIALLIVAVLFPHIPVTGRPAETRMGKGKGEVSYWTAQVRPGTVLFELSGVSEDMAREALRRQAHKLAIRTRMVKREE